MNLIRTWKKALRYAELACDDANNGNFAEAEAKLKKSNKLLLKINLESNKVEKYDFSPIMNNENIDKIFKRLFTDTYLLLAENCHQLTRVYSDLELQEESEKYLDYSRQLFERFLKEDKREDTFIFYLDNLYSFIVISKGFENLTKEIECLKDYMRVLAEALKSGARLDAETFKDAQTVINEIFQLVLNEEISIEVPIDILFKSLNDSGITSKQKEFFLWNNLAFYIIDYVCSDKPEIISEKEAELCEILNYLIACFAVSVEANVNLNEGDTATILNALKSFSKHFTNHELLKGIYNLTIDYLNTVSKLENKQHQIKTLENAIETLKSIPELKTYLSLLQLYNKLLILVSNEESPAAATKYYEEMLKLLDCLNLDELIDDDKFGFDEEEAKEQLLAAKAQTYSLLAANEQKLRHMEEFKKYLSESKKYSDQMNDDSEFLKQLELLQISFDSDNN